MTHQDLLDKSLSHPIIVFDGECIMCNGFIQWLISKDADQKIRYTYLQKQEHSPYPDLDSVLLYNKGKVYIYSDVSLEAATYLHKPYIYLSVLKYIPRFIRDAIYKVLAKYRYRIFGRYDTCMIPQADQRHLFIG
jgi:predicted DCC family thiol-disulfide oxidoreductase YuxK